MAQYRKRPVVIDAVQWNGDNRQAISFFCADAGFLSNSTVCLIETLEGTMRANAGDWIIKGVKGEFYSCKPDIFALTYEPVEYL